MLAGTILIHEFAVSSHGIVVPFPRTTAFVRVFSDVSGTENNVVNV